jgi:type II secretory pathway pseudopilin PulG
MSCRPSFRRAGFTLLEVILALGIAIGLLTVVLFFYQQAAQARSQILEESSRMTALRLLLDRITSDLRTALPPDDWNASLLGGPDFVQFVRADLPKFAPPTAATAKLQHEEILVRPPPSDLRQVGYVLSGSDADGVWVAGLVRWEEAFLPSAPPSSPVLDESAEPSAADSPDAELPEPAPTLPESGYSTASASMP